MTEALKETDGPKAVAAQGPASDDPAPIRWKLECSINGQPRTAEIHPFSSLLDTLRMEFGLTGSKGACTEGECGSCTVIIDGQIACACLVMAPQVQGCEVTTIEGLAVGPRLHVLQRKFIECGAVQCGYCTPGLIMAAKSLLENSPTCTEEEFVTGMEGNICRCTGYTKIFDAIRAAYHETSSAAPAQS